MHLKKSVILDKKLLGNIAIEKIANFCSNKLHKNILYISASVFFNLGTRYTSIKEENNFFYLS